jgi:hypothetical protein
MNLTGRFKTSLLGGLLLALANAAAQAADITDIYGYDAALEPPNGMNFDYEGCRLEKDDGTYLAGLGADPQVFTCADAAFTDGNLGKLYNELDLVPHRINTDSSGAPATVGDNVVYQLILGGDSDVGAAIGYDRIGAFTLLPGSDPSCALTRVFDPVAGPGEPGYEWGSIGDYGVGGGDTQVVIVAEISQLPDTECTWEFPLRLAISSSELSGSSNRSFVYAGTGAQSIPIPDVDNPITLAKDLAASQGARYTWTVSKGASPNSLNFGDTCEADPATPQTTDVTVTWTRSDPAPLGTVKVIADFTVTNSASRELIFRIRDTLTGGTTSLDLDALQSYEESLVSQTPGLACSWETVDTPAGLVRVIETSIPGLETTTCQATWNIPVETFEPTLAIDATLSNAATSGVYDTLFPSEECLCVLDAAAEATVAFSETSENATAKVVDTETLTGTNLYFVVDSVTSATASGTLNPATGTQVAPDTDVDWASCGSDPEFCLEDSGSVTFGKSVYFTSPLASGTLADTAVITGSDSEGAEDEDTASINITSNPLVDLVIEKTIEYALYEGDNDVQFCFEVESDDYNLTAAADDDGDPPCITFSFGDGVTKTVTLSDIPPGSYEVTELTPPSGWDVADNAYTVWAYPTAEDFDACDAKASFTNLLTSSATAKAIKDTDPDGAEAGWEFTLSWGEGQTETCSTASDGTCTFTEELLPGVTYTITETDSRIAEGGGWDDDGGSGMCGFTPTVDDALVGTTYTCYWENVQRGTVVIEKDTLPTPTSDSFAFSEDITAPTGSFQLTDGGDTTFENVLPGSYVVSETDPSPGCTLSDNPCSEAWDLLSLGCVDTDTGGTASGQSPSDPHAALIELDPGETVTCTFTNQLRGTVTVTKTQSGNTPAVGTWTFEVRTGASAGASGTVLATDSNDAAGVVDFDGGYFLPGAYQLCERGVSAGWSSDLTDSTYGNWFTPPGELEQDAVCVDFTLSAGEAESFDVDNTPPPGGIARTIGYWRNWSGECTNGNQEDVLGETLGGITLGMLTWPTIPTPETDPSTCDAVNILSKRNLDGEVRAFDPAYALASQYLAYLLNIAHGADPCPAILGTAPGDAQSLLSGVAFDGTDETAENSGKGRKKEAIYVLNKDKGEWIALASLFDQYNNNQLACGSP